MGEKGFTSLRRDSTFDPRLAELLNEACVKGYIEGATKHLEENSSAFETTENWIRAMATDLFEAITEEKPIRQIISEAAAKWDATVLE